MTAPLASSILAVLFALAGYAAGRYHQSQRSAGDREDAYQEGFEAATASTFSMAARIASPATPAAISADPPTAAQTALASSGAPAPGSIPAPSPLPGPTADARGPHTPTVEVRGPHTPAVEVRGSRSGAALGRGLASDSDAGTGTGTGKDFGHSTANGFAGTGLDDEDDGGSTLSPIAESAVGMPLGHRHMAQGGPHADGFPAPGPYGLDPADRPEVVAEQDEGAGSGAFFEPVVRDVAAEAPGPRAGRRGRHFVPDELVQATTYRLPADRVARAKVPNTVKPPEVGDDESDGSPHSVPQPRSS